VRQLDVNRASGRGNGTMVKSSCSLLQRFLAIGVDLEFFLRR
jgi:hypothetical protein